MIMEKYLKTKKRHEYNGCGFIVSDNRVDFFKVFIPKFESGTRGQSIRRHTRAV